MRLILLLAVLALGTDALLFNGSYTQTIWREASVFLGNLAGQAQDATRTAGS